MHDPKYSDNACLAGIWLALALNHFYEGNAGNGLIAIIGTWIAWVSIFGIVLWIFPCFNAVLKALREFEGKSPQVEERPSLDPKRR